MLQKEKTITGAEGKNRSKTIASAIVMAKSHELIGEGGFEIVNHPSYSLDLVLFLFPKLKVALE